jgi:hypothetical protein
MVGRRKVLFLSVASATLGRAVHAQAPHWLVGTWQGQVIGLRQGNNTRTMRVRSVAEDGTLDASWEGTTVPATFRNNELQLTTGAGTVVLLTRGADGNLSGSFTTNRGAGTRYSLIMQKQ